ncbi:MAG: hypothetical protein OHK0046_42630 [Anaerolineae bacterium]
MLRRLDLPLPRWTVNLFFALLAAVVVFALYSTAADPWSRMNADERNIAVLVFFGVIAVISALYSQHQKRAQLVFGSREWRGEFFQGISTEMVGAIVTGGLFILLVQGAETREAVLELVARLSSNNPTVASAALEEARGKGWLEDGTLNGADLEDANLSGQDLQWGQFTRARLDRADLSSAELWRTVFHQADFWEANLQDVQATEANFSLAQFQYTDLRGADLSHAELRGAYFQSADLRGTDLGLANIEFAYIDTQEVGFVTVFDDNTILPDGTKWTPETDWARFGVFTDYEAYQAWRAENRG